MKTKYMHTIGGKPASMTDYQICYYSTNNKIILRDTLKQIKSNQKKSIENRAKDGLTPCNDFGYVLVKV